MQSGLNLVPAISNNILQRLSSADIIIPASLTDGESVLQSLLSKTFGTPKISTSSDGSASSGFSHASMLCMMTVDTRNM